MGAQDSLRRAQKQRVACTLTFLMRHHKEGEGMLSHIVTGDEIWVSHITPESKTAVLTLEAYWFAGKEKVQAGVFNKEDHVHSILGHTRCFLGSNFAPRDTINSTVYCATLKKLRRAIQNKGRGMLSATILLPHDNARPHSAAQTQDLITSFKWEQMDHPPYSPDLTPSDYHLFVHLKGPGRQAI